MYDMPTGDRTSTITRILVICAVAVAAAAALVVLVNCAGPGRDATGRDSTAAGTTGDGAIGGSGQAPNPDTPDGGGSSGESTDPSGGSGDGDTGGDSGGGESGGGDGGGLQPDGGGLEPGPGGGGPEVAEEEEVEPAAEVCLSYDPAILTIENLGASGWRMRSGGHLMAMFDTYADAADMVKVARNFTKSCFIGRNNKLPNHYLYVIRYWKVPSGLPNGPAPTFDCVLYNPSTLTVKDQGEQGWRLYSGAKPLLWLASAADAERAKLVASGNMRLCYIGRDNDRPDPYRYIHEYWRA